ncbi:MAG: sugar phosphate isomerase/epimerase [Planctomycetes bacterium]|nr:sugar phosphate isomerase/epimerase [Planctomycetota bacterium]MBU4400815.1 sugar phosphate isomerase/epimerase [Planctomycetota bacterium]MCG2682927.1 sugar phosphate isomerase/epimerase [Planctomycetales bacterium]
MRYGMNLLLWADTIGDEALPLLDQIKEIGFDAVELPVFESDVKKYESWGKHLDNAGLARTAVTVRGADDNPMSPDPKIRRKGIEANKAALDCCRAAGAEALVGPFHSALGCFSGAGPTKDEWNWAVESMREVAEYAERCGVTLGLEYLNRFECYLLNTAADGARFCRAVDHPRCRMMYDTFHSHIEEKNTPAAIRELKGLLVHVHISENDRSTPGSGNVRWAETFDALHGIGYDNLMVIEAFGLSLERLIPATKIWRRMYENERRLAADGLAFMKGEVAKRWK